tara:strand:- start:264 stop:596 length:333 start_codon:yes stop_codon:yes gene_type:complete
MSSEYLKETLRSNEIKGKQLDKAISGALLSDEVVEPVSETRDKQVLIRVSESQRDQWAKAADKDGLSVSEWLRSMADFRYREIFECLHKIESRRVYPWSEHCMDCGARLR